MNELGYLGCKRTSRSGNRAPESVGAFYDD